MRIGAAHIEASERSVSMIRNSRGATAAMRAALMAVAAPALGKFDAAFVF